MSLQTLRDRVLRHNAERSLEYPVILDPELRAALDAVRLYVDKMAQASVQEGRDSQLESGESGRRTIGAGAIGDAARGIQTAMQDAQPILDQAAAQDALVTIKFHVPESWADDPQGHYSTLREQHADKDGDVAAAPFFDALLTSHYAGIWAPDGTSLEIETWREAYAAVLTEGDRDAIQAGLVDLYQGVQRNPLDRRHFGAPATS